MASPIYVGACPSVNRADFFEITDPWDQMCVALLDYAVAETAPLRQVRVFAPAEIRWGHARLFAENRRAKRRALTGLDAADRLEVYPLHVAETYCYENYPCMFEPPRKRSK